MTRRGVARRGVAGHRATRDGATRRALRLAGTVAAVVGLTGCGALPELPGPVPATIVGSATPTPVDPGFLSADGFDVARRIAVRVRNVGCDALSTGSGFALDAHTLVTNRHVVAGAAQLQLSTYDGRDVAVAAASAAGIADLALVRTAADLPAVPELATADPTIGDAVSVVGYPGGGQLTVTSGHVIARTTDPLHETIGEVVVTDAPVEPGSSGSAVLDAAGRVVGVVYAKNDADQSFVVPVGMLRTLLADDASFAPVASCATP